MKEISWKLQLYIWKTLIKMRPFWVLEMECYSSLTISHFCLRIIKVNLKWCAHFFHVKWNRVCLSRWPLSFWWGHRLSYIPADKVSRQRDWFVTVWVFVNLVRLYYRRSQFRCCCKLWKWVQGECSMNIRMS